MASTNFKGNTDAEGEENCAGPSVILSVPLKYLQSTDGNVGMEELTDNMNHNLPSLDSWVQDLAESKQNLVRKTRKFDLMISLVLCKLTEFLIIRFQLEGLARARTPNVSIGKTDSYSYEQSPSTRRSNDVKLKHDAGKVMKLTLVRKSENFWQVKNSEQESPRAKLSQNDKYRQTSVSAKISETEREIKQVSKTEFRKCPRPQLSEHGEKSQFCLSETDRNPNDKYIANVSLQKHLYDQPFRTPTPKKMEARLKRKSNTDPSYKRKKLTPSLHEVKSDGKIYTEERNTVIKSNSSKKPRKKLFYNCNVKQFFK